ncbi:uncharacterized protein [Clytia hemisphaerica]|uniref:RNA-directed RNA polymerase n=1 Tax=Clytia hemisphaerica TaxID=252671 RepID=A0A7M5V4Y0_9CNID
MEEESDLDQREKEDLKERENVFDLLENCDVYEIKETYRIPTTLVDDSKEKRKNPKSILIFEYDIPHKCFSFKGYEEPKSIFFEMFKQRVDFVSLFIIIKFADKAEDESLMNRDQVIESVLKKGVSFRGQSYHIVGCSNSQVRKKSFVFMQRSRKQCDEWMQNLIPGIGKLAIEKGVAKRVKYAGLLFSGCRYIVGLPRNYQVSQGLSYYSKTNSDFTDGCGVISLKLAREIVEKNAQLKKDWKSEVPSVWQIRFFGNINQKGCHLCKGVLVVDYSETTRSVITMRKSMMKVEVNQHYGPYFGIVETSLNSRIGKINKQVVTLLSETIEEKDLMAIQKYYLKSVSRGRYNSLEAFKGALLLRKASTFKGLVKKYGFKEIVPPGYTDIVLQMESQFKKSFKKSKVDINDRIQIPLASSRLMFGAAFPEHLHCYLNEGQCIVLTEKGPHVGDVIVCRSPSYSPGDIQILQAVSPPADFPKEMKNVILFATKGNRPVADKMSGGDLDGDSYLVVWDKRFLKYSNVIRDEKPVDFDHAAGKGIQRDVDWITYVAQWDNTVLAQIDSCFYEIAEEFGVRSEECREVCQIFSRAVDNIPDDAKRLKQIATRCSHEKFQQKACMQRSGQPVWEKMMVEGLKVLEDLKENRSQYPLLDDWKLFYESLVYTEKVELHNFLQSEMAKECLSCAFLDELGEAWMRILKIKRLSPVAKAAVECTFDCKDQSCPKRHSKDPNFYKESWLKKLDRELGCHVQQIKTKKLNTEAKLKVHEDLKRKMERAENVIEKEFSKELKKYEAYKDEILEYATNAEKACQMILRRTKDLETAEYDYQNALDSSGRFEIFQSRTQLRRKEELSMQVTEKEELLCDLYSLVAMEINEMAAIHQLPGILKIIFKGSGFKHGEISKNMIKDYWQRLEILSRRWRKTYQYPKKRLEPTSVENIDKLLAIKYQQLDEPVQKVQSLYQEKGDCEKRITEFERKAEETGKEEQDLLNKAVQLGNLLDSEDIPAIVAVLCNGDLWSDYIVDEETRGELVDSFLNIGDGKKKKNEAIFMKFRQHVTDEIMEKNQMIMSLKGGRKKYEKQKENWKLVIIEIGEIENKVQLIRNEISDLKMKYSEVYNEEEHKRLAKSFKVTFNVEQLAGFDLALSSLEREVDVYLDLDEVTKDDRVAITKTLTLSFKRETLRCNRDLTEHNLPVFRKRDEILKSLKKHDAVIVVAHTGSGKSTQVPQYLADDLHHVLKLGNSFPKVACTQPRRVACIRIAERVSQEYAGAVPIPTGTASKNREILYGDRRVAAYPLYAKLSQDDQDRALNTRDRVGYDRKMDNRDLPKEKKNQAIGKDLELKGTPGEVGEWVGFHIGSKGKSPEEKKNSKKFSKQTRVHFVTEGLLLQKLKGSRDSSYSCIIIDEAHERGRDTDLLLAHLHDIIKDSNKAYKGENLKVVVMSASINSKAFSEYFNNCPIVNCQGKMHDVGLEYLPPPKQKEGGRSGEGGSSDGGLSDSDYDSSWDSDGDLKIVRKKRFDVKEEKVVKKRGAEMSSLIHHAVDIIFNQILAEGVDGGRIERETAEGDILVFLPGQGEIFKCVDMINKRARDELNGVQNALNDGHRFKTTKVVCCTNIAETSLTIPGVTYVLDAGKAKKIRYDHKLRVSALKLTDISQASAKQRKGRAGRVEPGQCYRLYSEEHHDEEMEKFDEPEMKQMPIDELYLYAMDVSKGLENIHLMEDARPDPESVQSAKKRLLNLEYIESEQENEASFSSKEGRYGFVKYAAKVAYTSAEQILDLQITTEGKFAMSLSGEVSLEGARMILASKDYAGMVCDTIKLAVLMEENIYSNEELNHERAKYTNHLGDHMTIFNLYKHFEEKMKQSPYKAEGWCEELDLNFGTLKQMKRLFDRVYKTIKSDNLCGIGSLVDEENKRKQKEENEQKQREKEKGKRNKRTKSRRREDLVVEDLVSNAEIMMKIIIAGYFHNICVYNDPCFINAGYSMLTPINYGEKGANDPQNVDLLKVRLNNRSNLKETGDILQNTATIFRTLFEPADKLVLMLTSSRIKSEWIVESSSKRWQKSINLKVLCDGKIKSFVECQPKKHIGGRILAKIHQTKVKVEIEKKPREIRKLTHIQMLSNAMINVAFHSSEIKLYGSKKEIKKAREEVDQMYRTYYYDVINDDHLRRYPDREDSDKICDIKTGLVVSGKPKLPRPSITRNPDECNSGCLIINHQQGELNESQIEEMLTTLKPQLSDNVKENYEDPEINIFNSNKLAKIEFHRNDIAVELESLLRRRTNEFFPRGTKAFLDQELELRVIDTDLYPSVSDLVDDYPTVKLDVRKKIFRLKKKPKLRGNSNFQNELDEIVNSLREQKTFGSELIELTDRPYGERAFIYFKIKQMIDREINKDDDLVEVKAQKHPVMMFEIFGENENRTKVADKIRHKKKSLVRILEGSSSKVYNEKIPIRSVNSIGPVLHKMQALQQQNENVKIELKFGANTGNKELPVVHLICDDVDRRRRAREEIEILIQDGLKQAQVDSDRTKCCLCLKDVALPKSSKQKKKEREEAKRARDEFEPIREGRKVRIQQDEGLLEGRQLLLCGCTFCKTCLEMYLNERLDQQKGENVHQTINCQQCNGVLMVKDLGVLSFNAKEKICEKILMNYLRERIKDGEKFDVCGGCRAIYVFNVNDEGVYRCQNRKCRFLFCSVCRKRVMGNNKLDFEQHESCWERTNRSSNGYATSGLNHSTMVRSRSPTDHYTQQQQQLLHRTTSLQQRQPPQPQVRGIQRQNTTMSSRQRQAPQPQVRGLQRQNTLNQYQQQNTTMSLQQRQALMREAQLREYELRTRTLNWDQY